MQKNMLVGITLWLIAHICVTSCFDTIEQLNQYVAQYPEFPLSDNTDWEDPDYTSFHKSIQPSLFDRVKKRLGITPKKIWSPAIFEQLLADVTKQQNNELKKGRFVAKMACSNDTHFFIWQNLHGAFHSLARGLNFLVQKGIIDESFVIKNPNHFIIFNGDVVNRTAYTLELFTLILSLMKKNPHNVIYIMGKHEDREHWMSYSLKRELILRIPNTNAQKVPLRTEVSEFFSKLPLALYLYTPADQHTVIRISHRTREDNEINEELMNGFFDKKIAEESIAYYNLAQKIPTTSQVEISSIISTEEWRQGNRAASQDDEYEPGLGHLDQDRGSAAWSILSAPIATNKKFFDFHFDAFAELTINSPITKSTITLYNRDINTNAPFQKRGTFNLITGSKENLDKVPEIALVIGSSMSLVQGVPTMGQEVRRGFLLKINQQNRLGGIHGKPISVIIYNDDYTPALTLANIEKLTKQDKATIIMLTVGTPTTSVVSKQLENNELTVLFPVTGNPGFRDAAYKGLVNLRGSYADEVRVLIDHLITKTIAKKFLFFYQDDSYGITPLEVAHEELKKRGITDWVDVPYQRNSIDFKAQALKIRQAMPDAIGLFSTANATREVLREIGLQFLINKQLFGISFLGEEPFRQYLKEVGLSVLFGAVVPNPRTSDLPIVKEYRKAMDEYHYAYDVFSLEAYIATSILIDALEKIEGPITREKIMHQIELIKNYDFKGLHLSFNPLHRDLLNTVWIETGDNSEWIEKEIVGKENTTSEMVTSTHQIVDTKSTTTIQGEAQ